MSGDDALRRGSGSRTPPVSIVVPVYNTEAFVAEAFDSALRQSLPGVEIVVVDDGSTDRSAEICREYARAHPNVILRRQENRGVSAARNAGLEVSSGDFVFFLDSDDTIDPDFVRRAHQIAKAEGSDLVVLGAALARWGLDRIPALPTWGMFLRRDFLARHPDIRFPEGIHPCEDGLFSHMLLAVTDRVAHDPDARYHYRLHPGQKTQAVAEDLERLLLEIPKWFAVLERFHDRLGLDRRRARHWLRFLEHEPFELRFRQLPWSAEQKRRLFEMIRDAARPLEAYGRGPLSKEFRLLLDAADFAEFEANVARASRRDDLLHRVLWRATEYVPDETLRAKLRHRYRALVVT